MFRNVEALPRLPRKGPRVGQTLMTAAMESDATAGQAIDIAIKVVGREAENAIGARTFQQRRLFARP
jgi:hypothetical protein